LKSKKGERSMFKCFMFQPVCSGIMGFTLFLSIIILVKFLSHSLGFQPVFGVDIYDVVLSALGFVLAFLIRFIDNFKKNAN
ncbi:MAG TPA: hypothetical protein PL041_10255, partial [Melioribacteraceae bacterium]|nr:hypothetical protein [Melioribacteraceae bacterium]